MVVVQAESAIVTAIERVRSVYQPIVDLASGAVVAHEALARGPEGSPLELPGALFAAAGHAGLLPELDWACRVAAVRGAAAHGGPLFVNVEPSTVRSPCPEHLRDEHDAAAARLPLVLEITERALTDDPATLLAVVADARRAGWRIALDDVGAEPASLALLPYLRPDVIKLDMRLCQQPDGATVEVVHAVRAEAERTGALILAEGIENEQHLERALTLGATLGQGWHFGRPGALRPVAGTVPPLGPLAPAAGTPFDIVAAHRPVQRSTKRLLLPMSVFLEERSLREPEPGVVLATFQEAANFTPVTARRYERLAGRCAFVGAVAHGLGPVPAAGVRGAALHPDDPVRRQWNVLVTAPHFAGALVARDLGDAGPDGDRRFDYVITHDRDLVAAAARSLFGRIVPVD